MVLSNYARQRVALLIGGSGDNLGSGFLGLGSGSGILTTSTTGLQHQVDRNQFTSFTHTPQQVRMIADFNSSELSGLTIREFAVFVESSGGKAWQVENLQAITFTGNEELQIQIDWQVF